MLRFAKIPLLTLLLITYNIMLFIYGIDFDLYLNSEIFAVTLFSGAYFGLILEDALVIVGIFLLFLEVIKSTRTGTVTAVEHIFSMFVFLIFMVQFITVSRLGIPSFLIITLFAMFDVLAGFTISIVTARRDISIG